jgi:hypothetical protein
LLICTINVFGLKSTDAKDSQTTKLYHALALITSANALNSSTAETLAKMIRVALSSVVDPMSSLSTVKVKFIAKGVDTILLSTQIIERLMDQSRSSVVIRQSCL